MTETEQMQETEKQQFTEFKRRLNMQAAQAQVGKIEYELSSATAEKDVLRRACREASALKLGAICVLPDMVRTCALYLGKETKTLLIACVSYPHGGDVTKVKIAAVKTAVKDGADEVEVTAPIAFIKEKNWSYVKREFKKLKSAAKKCTLRINIESGLLTLDEITKTCTVAADCGITSLRASSGVNCIFNAEVISHMSAAVKDKCTIKADGIATVSDMVTAVSMGATIIGSKNAVDLSRLVLQTSV